MGTLSCLRHELFEVIYVQQKVDDHLRRMCTHGLVLKPMNDPCFQLIRYLPRSFLPILSENVELDHRRAQAIAVGTEGVPTVPRQVLNQFVEQLSDSLIDQLRIHHSLRYTLISGNCVGLLLDHPILAAEDKDRFALIQAGDETAFEGLFREHYAALCGFARKFVADKETAEELVQDMFMQFWDKRLNLNLEVSLRAYLFTAIRNSCLNHLKHLTVRDRHADHARSLEIKHAVDPSQELETAELQARIQLAIADLPDRCGEIFKMSRFEGLKYEEIAQKLELSPRTVEVQIGKALKILRQTLAEWLPMMILWLGADFFS
jgi:RNA polymerase sigma-70 factor (family 1)